MRQCLCNFRCSKWMWKRFVWGLHGADRGLPRLMGRPRGQDFPLSWYSASKWFPYDFAGTTTRLNLAQIGVLHKSIIRAVTCNRMIARGSTTRADLDLFSYRNLCIVSLFPLYYHLVMTHAKRCDNWNCYTSPYIKSHYIIHPIYQKRWNNSTSRWIILPVNNLPYSMFWWWLGAFDS